MRALATAIAALALAAPASGAAPSLDGVSGPKPVDTVNLAGEWGFDPAGARPPTSIQVPGGGWVKQGFYDVVEASYSRRIEIPTSAAGRVVKLELGAVNHEATLYVDGHKVGTRLTSFTPQSFDLTDFVEAGQTHELRLDVKGRGALATYGKGLPNPPGNIGPIYTVPTAAEWSEAIPQGIFRSARLATYPELHISDAFVRTSVANGTIEHDVWVTNGGDGDRTGTLRGVLGSWNGRGWAYPTIPDMTVTVPAGETRKVTIGPLAWQAGVDSYWWPNVPYRPGYRAQLHELDLTLASGGHSHAAHQRFGFRESRQVGTHYELNGVRVNFRGDSLQGAQYDRIRHGGGQGDAFDTLPGFMPPGEDNPTGGWPQAVDNYQRLNMNALRIHQEPASPYMLDVADEMGLMLTVESAIRGSESRQDYREPYTQNFVSHLRDLVRRDRSHASVLRWSQSNESDIIGSATDAFEEQLYATIKANDPTRPVFLDFSSDERNAISHADFSAFAHYVNEDGSLGGWTDDIHARPDRPYGRGEFIWPMNTTRQGFAWFATTVAKMREAAYPETESGRPYEQAGPADLRPYSLAGAWASVIPGVKSTDFIGDGYTPPLYGEDNLPEPWEHPIVRDVQKGFHPLLVADSDFWWQHRESDALGNFPTAAPTTITAGAEVTRTLAIFNDLLDADQVQVTWEARRGSASGELLGAGALDVALAPGERARRGITFTAPAEPGEKVVLVLSSSAAGEELFRDDETVFTTILAGGA